MLRRLRPDSSHLLVRSDAWRKERLEPMMLSCPGTSDHFLGLLPGAAEPRVDDLHMISCAACDGVYFIDLRTGPIMGSERSYVHSNGVNRIRRLRALAGARGTRARARLRSPAHPRHDAAEHGDVSPTRDVT